jgi:two-component system, cell cycle sensor histidine kinase and response regulator CckA
MLPSIPERTRQKPGATASDLQAKRGAIMASGRRPHILYLEDDKDVHGITIIMLEQLGCSVRGETDSLKALRSFSEEPDAFNLGILETVMPQLSGLELAARFKRIRPSFPVLFYTGRANRSWAPKIEAAGFGWVVFKPLPMDRLGVAIREALKGEPKGTARRP